MNFTKNTFSNLLGIDRVHVNYHRMTYDTVNNLADVSLYVDENPDRTVVQIARAFQR